MHDPAVCHASPPFGCASWVASFLESSCLRWLCLLQQLLEYFPPRVARQLRAELDDARNFASPEVLTAELLDVGLGCVLSRFQDDHGLHAFTIDLIRDTDHGRVQYGWELKEDVLDFEAVDRFASPLHHVLQSVAKRDEAVGLDGDSIAGTKTSILEYASGRRRVVSVYAPQ